MKQAIYLYQAAPSRGEMLLANDSSSFTLPFFAKAQEILAKVHSFPLSEEISFYPNNMSEDPVMELSRTNFRLSEWLLPALIIDGEDEPSTALLLNRAHPENVLVVSLLDKEVLVRCFNGVEICEEEGETMSGKEFLSTLSLTPNPTSFSPERQSKPANLGYYVPEDEEKDSDDDAPVYIEVARPAFEPSSKKGTLDLGSSYAFSAPSEEEEDDEPVHIDVAKETFSALSSKKPRDLGSFFKDRKKKTFVTDVEEQEEPNQEAIANSFLRPAFEPNVQSKAPTPQASFASPKVPNQRKYNSKGNEKAGQPSFKGKEAAPLVKPDFEPNSNKKPASVLASNKPMNQRQYKAKEEIPETKAKESPSLPPKASEAYVFCRRKDVPGSVTILNDPSLMFVSGKFAREGKRRFGLVPKDIDSSKTQFVALSEAIKQACLEKALVPTIETWDLLAMNVEKNGMPYEYLLSSKEDPLLCAVYDLDEKDRLSLRCLTHNGVSIEDPSLDYEALRSLCFPNREL